MILKYFIELIVFIAGNILSLISSIFPGFDQLSTLTDAVNMIFGVTTQIPNFAYFVMGEFYFTAIVLLSFILPLRYITVPILSFVRKLIVWGGN